MTDDYRIEKTRRRVEVTLANANRLEGDVFVQPFALHRDGEGRDRPSQRLVRHCDHEAGIDAAGEV